MGMTMQYTKSSRWHTITVSFSFLLPIILVGLIGPLCLQVWWLVAWFLKSLMVHLMCVKYGSFRSSSITSSSFLHPLKHHRFLDLKKPWKLQFFFPLYVFSLPLGLSPEWKMRWDEEQVATFSSNLRVWQYDYGDCIIKREIFSFHAMLLL